MLCTCLYVLGINQILTGFFRYAYKRKIYSIILGVIFEPSGVSILRFHSNIILVIEFPYAKLKISEILNKKISIMYYSKMLIISN